eukprot:5764219-Lingulodinium_polyedra.AAC.1
MLLGASVRVDQKYRPYLFEALSGEHCHSQLCDLRHLEEAEVLARRFVFVLRGSIFGTERDP